MLLFLLRHGEAEFANVADPDRKLTRRGEVEVAATVNLCRNHLQNLDTIISSPYTRARQTTAIVIREMGFRGQLLFSKSLLPDSSISALDPLVVETGGRQILVVGHQPFMGSLLSWLTDRPELASMATATLSALETEYFARGGSRLIAQVHP